MSIKGEGGAAPYAINSRTVDIARIHCFANSPRCGVRLDRVHVLPIRCEFLDIAHMHALLFAHSFIKI